MWRCAMLHNKTVPTPPISHCCSPSWPTSSPVQTLVINGPCSLTVAMTCSPTPLQNTLRELAGQQGLQAAAAQRATVLLDLARSGDAEPVFEALTEPSRFPSLLHTLASRSDAESIGSAALVAYTAAATIAEAATAVFYLAVAMATGGDQEQAHDLIGQARAADPAQVPAWINELAELGQQHQGVLQLIPALIAPADQPSPPESSSEDTDDRAD